MRPRVTAQFVLCDVFAERPFAGNQLAVFLDGALVNDETMASLAREFGWSEITFVLPAEGGGPIRVRIWTPQGELPFAGHPVVGTAVVLAAEGLTQPGLTLLELGIGAVAVEVSLTGPAGGTAIMTQQQPAFGRILDDRATLAAAVGLG
jgi:trans-2,3-dihydro-3-hydroxyanthranilate isomerase